MPGDDDDGEVPRALRRKTSIGGGGADSDLLEVNVVAAIFLFDPPGGWEHGFPKKVPASEKEAVLADLSGWLLANGYPQELIDMQNGNVRCRIIGPFEVDDEPDQS